MVVILDLGLGERRLVRDAPQGRAQALVKLFFLSEVGERFDDRPLEPRVDRHVRLVEVTEQPHPEHLRPLPVEPVQCPFAALGPQLQRVDLVEVEFEVDQRLALDRQPVHVPSGDEVGPAPVEQVDLHEGVLEDAVQEVPHVQVAVGIRRPVVEDERRIPGVGGEPAPVDVVFLPPADPVGLAFGEFGPHREVGFGQVEGAAVVVAGRLGFGHGRPDLRADSGPSMQAVTSVSSQKCDSAHAREGSAVPRTRPSYFSTRMSLGEELSTRGEPEVAIEWRRRNSRRHR